MKLNSKQGNILKLIEHHADKPVSWYQKQLGLKTPTINYHLQTLSERGVIVNKNRPFINTYLLGITDFTIYFSLSSYEHAVKEKLLQVLQDSEYVSWIGLISGEYHFGIAIYAQNSAEASYFFKDLIGKFKNLIYQKSISVRVSFNAFGRKYLSNKKLETKVLSFKYGEMVEIDDLDKQILSAASNNIYSSNRELARLTDIPFTTLERRVTRLEKAKIIAGYIYRYNLSMLKMYQYRLLFSCQSMTEKLYQEIYDFSLKHPHVLHFIECIGAWDYEIGVEVGNTKELDEIIQTLYSKFGTQIGAVKILQIVQHLKFSSYPFKV